MNVAAPCDWKSEEEVLVDEFLAGYELEAAPAGLRPEKREDGRDSELAYTQLEGTVSETTLYADRPDEKYKPSESLGGRFGTRRAKYARLWELNAGRDDHTVAGKTYTDSEIHKVNQPARDRARFVHAVAISVELSKCVLNYSTSLARKLDPRAFNYWGGMDVFILAVVKQAALEYDWKMDTDAFHSIREQWGVGVEDLDAAFGKLQQELRTDSNEKIGSGRGLNSAA